MKRIAYVLVALALFPVPFGANGRDFAGRYDLKDAVQTPQGISVVFFVDVQNVSGRALDGVVFELEGDGPAIAVAMGPLDLPASATVGLSVQLTVTQATYAQWLAGAAKLTGGWTDSDGSVQRRVVELTRVPLPDEVAQ